MKHHDELKKSVGKTHPFSTILSRVYANCRYFPLFLRVCRGLLGLPGLPVFAEFCQVCRGLLVALGPSDIELIPILSSFPAMVSDEKRTYLFIFSLGFIRFPHVLAHFITRFYLFSPLLPLIRGFHPVPFLLQCVMHYLYLISL